MKMGENLLYLMNKRASFFFRKAQNDKTTLNKAANIFNQTFAW